MDDSDLRGTLGRLPPAARSDLRRLLFADQADRDQVAEQLLKQRTPEATNFADFLDVGDHEKCSEPITKSAELAQIIGAPSSLSS